MEHLFKIKVFFFFPFNKLCGTSGKRKRRTNFFTKKAVFKLIDSKSLETGGMRGFIIKPSLFNSSFPHVEIYFSCCQLVSSTLLVFNCVFQQYQFSRMILGPAGYFHTVHSCILFNKLVCLGYFPLIKLYFWLRLPN